MGIVDRAWSAHPRSVPCGGAGVAVLYVRCHQEGDQVKVPDETLLWKEKIQKVELLVDFNLQDLRGLVLILF
ncbi:Uncharacterised protein [Dermatophilus congolensis]|uniref:Uncharacterized protein n=1 Tax=Dermatophilus congolensis TaxID=1863 RepID=A0AA46BMM4_9MICO|nr:Uncharacterised protein [Dermatophilus congolensis]